MRLQKRTYGAHFKFTNYIEEKRHETIIEVRNLLSRGWLLVGLWEDPMGILHHTHLQHPARRRDMLTGWPNSCGVTGAARGENARHKWVGTEMSFK